MAGPIKVNTDELLASAGKIGGSVAAGTLATAAGTFAQADFATSVGATATTVSTLPDTTTSLSGTIDELATRTAHVLEQAALYFDDVDADLANSFGAE